MERDLPGGSDVGSDLGREFGDEPAPAYRDAAPDYLAPLDDSGPVSGHVPAPEATESAMDAPEHDWESRQGPDLPRLPSGRHTGAGDRDPRS